MFWTNSVDIQQIPRSARGDERTRVDQGRARTFCGADGNQTSYQAPVIGDTQLFAGLDPGQIARCVLPQFPNADLIHTSTVAPYVLHLFFPDLTLGDGDRRYGRRNLARSGDVRSDRRAGSFSSRRPRWPGRLPVPGWPSRRGPGPAIRPDPRRPSSAHRCRSRPCRERPCPERRSAPCLPIVRCL